MQFISFDRSIDQLENDLVSLSKERNATEYRFLVLVHEFEVRQGYRLWMLNNTAEWLNMKCGISLGAAREKVRVAQALFDKPEWSAAFREGELSYSKARAMTRVPDPDESALLSFALNQTAARVDEHCRQLRNADRKVSTADANRAHGARWVSCSQDADGMVHLSADLPPETGLLVMKALEIAAKTLEDGQGGAADAAKAGATAADGEWADTAAGGKEGFFAKQADALVEMARSYMAGESAGRSGDNYQVLLKVDAKALQDKGGKSDLPIETMRRLTCDASVVPVLMDENGDPLNVGRKQRTVPAHIHRAVVARDGPCCIFPGCSNTKWLEDHHVKHWAEGGDTSAENILLMCPSHHRLLHEGGYTIHVNHEGKRYFKTRHNKIVAEPIADTEPYASRDACCEISLIENDVEDIEGVEESPPVYLAAGGA